MPYKRLQMWFNQKLKAGNKVFYFDRDMSVYYLIN